MSVQAVGIRARKVSIIPFFFGIFMLFLLAGYAMFGRGFAYLGVPPLFIGEAGVVFAVAALFAGFYQAVWRSPITWLLVAFALWCAAQTFPYINEYGIAALRDAVIWAYAIFSLAIASVVLKLNAIDTVVVLYRKAIPAFLVGIVIVLGIQFVFGSSIPQWPWGALGGVGGTSGVPIIEVKMGDLAVHLAGIFAFVILSVSTKPLRLPWYVLWAVIAAVPGLLSRGAFVTIGAVISASAFMRPTRRYFYIMLFIGSAFIAAYMTSAEVDLGARSGRVISVEQLMSNIESIVTSGGREDLSGTKLWRQLWWDKIFDYTFYGKYFWTGKGFGINLADDDGFQVEADGSLRNPHSVHMAILARAGVPGFVLWLVLQTTFGVTLFLKYLKDRRFNRVRLARTEGWILLYWVAFLINATFDVTIEGPQGGIWFWSVFGLGLALILTPGTSAESSARQSISVPPARTKPAVPNV